MTWGLVLCTRQGFALDAANVRRSFRLVASAAGLNPKEWTPRELRHSFVSLLSSSGVTIEDLGDSLRRSKGERGDDHAAGRRSITELPIGQCRR